MTTPSSHQHRRSRRPLRRGPVLAVAAAVVVAAGVVGFVVQSHSDRKQTSADAARPGAPATTARPSASVPPPSKSVSPTPSAVRSTPAKRRAVPATDRGAADLGGCAVAPADSIWRTRIDKLPASPRSAAYVAGIGASKHLKADFGSGTWEGAPFGIPITSIPPGTPDAKVSFDFADESDKGPYPIPSGALIEGGAQAQGDRHIIALDRARCRVYELYDAHPQGNGAWHAGSGATFDLRSNALRPAGWTSADAAGLPILPGLARYDEARSGTINHALRITVPRSQQAYVWPARHQASSETDTGLPPMGLRLRLKAGVDISRLSPQSRAIAQALKTYGAIVADNGSAWYVSGTQDDRWNNDALHQLDDLTGDDFEAVDVSGLRESANSGTAHQP